MTRAVIGIVLVVVAAVAVVAALHRSPARPLGPAPIGTQGFDVSWPQCAGTSAGRMPPGRPSYLLLGLTHGAGDTVNPCFVSQLDWARSRGVRVGAYLVASYPPKAERALAGNGLFGACGTSVRCQLRNNGAAQAQAAVATLHAAGLVVPMLWIDVELSTVLPWSRHTAANVALLRGVLGGLRAARIPVGVYTTTSMWRQITGGLHLNIPNWLPSGDGRAHHAARLCRTSATGGVTWLVQYTRTLDADLTCPVLDAVPGQPGPLWQFRDSTLQLLSHGAAVSAVQQVVGAPVTGTYDAATAAAVSRWQASKHLTVSGKISPTDWQAMGADRLVGGHPILLSRFASGP
jgi:peptidoglycan hydrolase-like protein with peptidoglycan-binding domain